MKILTKNKKKYSFKGKVWKYKGHAGWVFVTLPKSLSKTLRKLHGPAEEGWGRLRLQAQTGKTKWETAIWYDTKVKSYLLPLKSQIRKAEKIEEENKLTIELIVDIGVLGF